MGTVWKLHSFFFRFSLQSVTCLPTSKTHTHHTLQFADIFQLNLSVLQLLGESFLNALSLQPPRFALLQLIGDTESKWMSRRWQHAQTGECTAECTWQCRRSSCSLLPLGRFCPRLSTVERSSWASASRAWVLFRSLLSFFSTSKSLWPTWKTRHLILTFHRPGPGHSSRVQSQHYRDNCRLIAAYACLMPLM